MKFSANLGFLWQDLPLPKAIYAAYEAGFSAVECHWPYEENSQDVRKALQDTQLPMLGLNTVVGDRQQGENGLCALLGREQDAQKSIEDAFDYGAKIGAKNVHVMAGIAKGEEAKQVFIDNLNTACDRAKIEGMGVLIEPLNKYDVPGYFLQTAEQACTILDEISRSEAKMMFDLYHIQRMSGHLSDKLIKMKSYIGHIQFAAVPGRGEPLKGELNFPFLFDLIEKENIVPFVGAEYRPNGPTELSLDWLKQWSREH